MSNDTGGENTVIVSIDFDSDAISNDSVVSKAVIINGKIVLRIEMPKKTVVKEAEYLGMRTNDIDGLTFVSWEYSFRVPENAKNVKCTYEVG